MQLIYQQMTIRFDEIHLVKYVAQRTIEMAD